MANGRTSKNEHEFRVNKVARLMSVGTVRSDILQFATTEWGVTQRTVDSYISDAREILKQDFDICLLYTSPSPRDNTTSRMPSSA